MRSTGGALSCILPKTNDKKDWVFFSIKVYFPLATFTDIFQFQHINLYKKGT